MHEIGHLDPIDQESVLFDGIAHLISVFGAVECFRPQVRDWVDDHFEQFVACGHAHQLIVRKGGLDEDLRDRLAIFGQIVIAERAGRICVVEVYELPIRGLWSLGVVQGYRVAPDRKEVQVVTCLQSGGELDERHAEIDRSLVDTGNAYRTTLPGLGRMNFVHGSFSLASDCAVFAVRATAKVAGGGFAIGWTPRCLSIHSRSDVMPRSKKWGVIHVSAEKMSL